MWQKLLKVGTSIQGLPSTEDFSEPAEFLYPFSKRINDISECMRQPSLPLNLLIYQTNSIGCTMQW